MPLDFKPSELAKADFDQKMAAFKATDTALVAAQGARDAAAADLAAKEKAVTDAEAAVKAADAEADASFANYTHELDVIGITPTAAAPPATPTQPIPPVAAPKPVAA